MRQMRQTHSKALLRLRDQHHTTERAWDLDRAEEADQIAALLANHQNSFGADAHLRSAPRIQRPAFAMRRRPRECARPVGLRTLLMATGVTFGLSAGVLVLIPVAPGTPGIGILRAGLIGGIALVGAVCLLRGRLMRD